MQVASTEWSLSDFSSRSQALYPFLYESHMRNFEILELGNFEIGGTIFLDIFHRPASIISVNMFLISFPYFLI